MSVDLHTPQIQGFFDGPVDHLWALPLLADYVASKYEAENLTVVSPDSGRVRVADIWAERLGTPLAIIHKRRDPNVANQVTVSEIVGQVDGRVCLLVDDMIDTGGTIVKAAQALKKNGAERVIVAATHAVFSDPASERLQDAAIDEVVVTDTIPIPDRKLVVVNSEAIMENCAEPANYTALVDVSDETKPRLASIFPTPVPPADAPYRNYCVKGGRFGPHNQHQWQHQECLYRNDNLVFMTYFNAGLRIFDISDPWLPKEVAFFEPPDAAS